MLKIRISRTKNYMGKRKRKIKKLKSQSKSTLKQIDFEVLLTYKYDLFYFKYF